MTESALGPSAVREGVICLDADPGILRPDAGVVFIGRIASPWSDRSDCPKNMAAARERGGGAQLHLHAPYRAGLKGLDGFSHAVVLSWLHHSRRDLIVQKPRHASAARGTFALRSPVRPNPIGLHVVRIVGVDADGGIVELDAIDVLDGTPLVDLKPYFASADMAPDAHRPKDGDTR